jgi:hypothetical protein
MNESQKASLSSVVKNKECLEVEYILLILFDNISEWGRERASKT